MPADRVEMLWMLGLDGKDCAEVGVFDGWFSGKILETNPNTLTMVDPWVHQNPELYPDDQANMPDESFDSMFARVVEKFGHDQRVKIARDFSYSYAAKVPYESLDFVYIDAIHTYDSCLCDSLVWYQKVKPGGWLCGHDYTGKYLGVRYAVDSFLKITGEELEFVTAEPWASWGVRKDERNNWNA